MKENARKREEKGREEEEECNEKVINSSEGFIFYFFPICTTSALFISGRLIARIS